MDEELIKDYFNLTQSLSDLIGVNTDEFVENDNSDDIDLHCDYPYLIFMRTDLIRVMNLCSKLVRIKSDLPSYNSINLVPMPSFRKLNFYATTELSHFRYEGELIGDSDEMIKDNIAVPFVILQKIIKLMGRKVLIYLKDNNYYIRLLNGDLILDIRPANMNILTFPGEIGDKLAEIGVDTLGSTVNSILPLLSSEIKGEARKISFTGTKAYYNSSFYYIESSINTPRMVLSYKDADFISKISKYYLGEKIQIFSVVSKLPRFYLKIR